MTTDQNKVVTFASNIAQTGSLQYISWATSDVVGSDAKIRITLPNENGGQQMEFDLVGSFFTSETDYVVSGKCSFGQIAIYVTSLGKGATIDLGPSRYEIFPLGDTKGVSIKRDTTVNVGTCDNAEPTEEQNPLGFCETDCGDSYIDVLYMITPEAKLWYQNQYGIFWPVFLYTEAMSFNMGLTNSSVLNKRARFRFIDYIPAFPLGVNGAKLGEDCGKLNNDVNGQPSDAVLTLQQYGADVGILVVNLPFNDQNIGYGFATSNSTSATNSYERFSCIQAFAVGQYHYAHELAHQIGCQHGTDIGGPSPGCPNGKFLEQNNRVTIVAKGALRIPNFSNPVIDYMGELTGQLHVRDNAAQLRGAFCEIANNNSPTYFGASYVYYPEVKLGCPFSATATVDPGVQEIPGSSMLYDCPGPYNYQWSWTSNLLSPFQTIGTNSPNLELSSPPNCPIFYLKVRVTTPSGCEVVQIQLITCQPSFPSTSCSRSSEAEIYSHNYENYQIIPNPARDNINVVLNDFNTVSSITAVGANGALVANLNPLSFENGLLNCDVSNLPSGLWFLNIKGPEKTVVLKLAIGR